MGLRGPKPLPKNVHLLRGNPGKIPLARLQESVDAEVEIPDLPRHLLPEAVAFWNRMAPELVKLGLVAKIDQAALAQASQWWAWWVYHDAMFQRDVRAAEDGRREWEAEEQAKRAEAEAAGKKYRVQPWMGGDGIQVPQPNGGFAYNPNWVAAHKASDKLDRALAHFGMSPSSRSRVTPSRRLPLPGAAEEAKDGFSAL